MTKLKLTDKESQRLYLLFEKRLKARIISQKLSKEEIENMDLDMGGVFTWGKDTPYQDFIDTCAGFLVQYYKDNYVNTKEEFAEKVKDMLNQVYSNISDINERGKKISKMEFDALEKQFIEIDNAIDEFAEED